MASGDVVNTASRLQSAAPVNGVLVDETTYRATRAAVDYAQAEAVEAKGKAEPIAVWEAKAAHSRLGVDVAHEARSELVGRARELGLVRDAFARARDERTPHLLTLVGVPGIGKSRLVYELQRIVDAEPELITWRQGRCLAYGDGVTLWALGEIVKAQVGIVEEDSTTEIAARSTTPSSTRSPARATREGSKPGFSTSSGSAKSPSSAKIVETRRSPHGAAFSRDWRSNARSCSSSRTFTGPTKPCSTSWTSSSIG